MYIGFKMMVFRGADPAGAGVKILFSIDCEMPEQTILTIDGVNKAIMR